MANPLLSLASAAARWLPAGLKRGLYRLGPVSRGLRNALNKSAPAGLPETKVAAGLLAGASLLLDLQTEKDYWLGTYEMDLQRAIRDWVKPDPSLTPEEEKIVERYCAKVAFRKQCEARWLQMIQLGL